jgi:hypothetical protein
MGQTLSRELKGVHSLQMSVYKIILMQKSLFIITLIMINNHEKGNLMSMLFDRLMYQEPVVRSPNKHYPLADKIYR